MTFQNDKSPDDLFVIPSSAENRRAEVENVRGKYTLAQKELTFEEKIDFYNNNDNFTVSSPLLLEQPKSPLL